MSHLEQRLENDLQLIRSRVLEQAKNVQQGVNDAIHALQTGDNKLAYSTILNDHPINRNMRAIDRLCHKFIAIHLPSGSHLRLLSSIIRINIELERMGDYAVVMAREAVQLNKAPEGNIAREINRISAETSLMLKQAITAFEELNADLARSTMMMSGNMEYNLDVVYQEITQDNQVEKAKDTLAVFVIFTQLKRVADQAKNLCEDTIFAVTGQQKTPKVYNILFIDEDNSLFSQLAAAIAQKDYPDICKYRSAGRQAAENINPKLLEFLGSRGADIGEMQPVGLTDFTHHDISEQNVVVSLQGGVKSYIDSIPFHTTALEWDIDTESALDSDEGMENLYRTLALHVRDLIELLRGDEV